MSGKKTLGAKIKLLRTTMGLSQEKLAELIDINTRNLSKIETDLSFPSAENLYKLSKVLNFDINEIFEDNFKGKSVPKNTQIAKLIAEINDLSEEDLKIVAGLVKTIKKVRH